jgi:hypothetical protein
MPGPPPPSKSYLLVLNSDSEDDDSVHEVANDRNEPTVKPTNVPLVTSHLPIATPITTPIIPYHHHHHHVISPEKLVENKSSSINDDISLSPLSLNDLVSKNDSSNQLMVPKDHHLHQTTQQLSMTENNLCSKKKRRRRRHRKKDEHSSQPKNVSFGTVQIHLIERVLGGEGVPASGGWPLGLGDHILEADPILVDEYDQQRQCILQDRWKSISPQKNRQEVSSQLTLETRQWDYKHDRDARGSSIRNPLFSFLSEDQRQNLLRYGTTSHMMDEGKQTLLGGSKNKHSQNNKPQGKSKKHAGGGNNTTNNFPRPRADSVDSYKSFSSLGGRTRSQSMDSDTSFDPILVRHYRNSLEEIRNHRSQNEVGCSCRKLTVSKKWSISRIKEELRRRHALPSSLATTSTPSIHTTATTTSTVPTTRAEWETCLEEVLKEEPCCSKFQCPCYKEGLMCHAETCSCGKSTTTNQGKNAIKKIMTTVEEIQAACGNLYGMYVVDFQHIRMYRQEIFCQFIATTNTTNTTIVFDDQGS